MQTQTYAFDCQKACRSHRIDGRELWTLTVRAKDLPLGWKYGPNARYAEINTKAAKEMLETIAVDPASFVFKNNGIMVVADSIKVEGTEVALVCREPDPDEDAPGHGVLNGGHTYKVLKHALESRDPRYKDVADKVFVTITVGIGIPEEEIWRISRARNTSEKVPLHALRELAGDWSIVKNNLPVASRHLVAFKPNDPEAPDAEYDTTDLIRRLALLNNQMFPAEQGVHPVSAYVSIGTVVKKYTPAAFALVAPVLPDVIRLEELVVRHWEEVNGRGKLAMIANASGCSAESSVLLSGYKSRLTLADPFVLPVIAAFRVFLTNGQWHQPMQELWERFGAKTVQALWETYKETGKSSAAVFGRARGSWAAACDLTKSAAIQMGLIQIA